MLSGKYSFKLYDELVGALSPNYITARLSYSLVGIYSTLFTLTIVRFDNPATIYPRGASCNNEMEVLRPCYARVYVITSTLILCLGRYINAKQTSPLTAELNALPLKVVVFRLKSNATTTPISMSCNGYINGNSDLNTLVEVLKTLKDQLVCVLIDVSVTKEFISILATF